MFGQAGNTSFGGFNTATQSSPFGQSAFSKPITTTSFGTAAPPVFGGPNTSLFSSKPAGVPSGGLFGSGVATPAFGQPATTQSSFGGFGTTNTSTNLFGSQQNANTSLFGSGATTPAFGVAATKPAGFGTFGTTTSTNLFGQPQQPNQQTTPFGQTSAPANTSLFGTSTGFGTANAATGMTGTVVKFNPVTGSDTMVKSGVTQTISTRHHCITCMKEYESKSLEELRLEDYTAGRKGVAQAAQTTGLFGAPTQPSPFGTPNAASAGTSTASTGFGTMGTGFGATSQPGTSSLFGKPLGFGTPATTSSAFAFNSTTPSTNLFGANQTKPFGVSAPTQLFSSANTGTTVAPAFGTGTNTAPNTFGVFGGTQPNQSIGLFNQSKPVFNIPSSGTGTGFGTGFGTPAATNQSNTGGLFAAKSMSGFGTPSTFGTTGTTAFGTGQGFNATGQNPSGSLFNTTFKPAGQTSGYTFGTNTASTTGLGTGTGLNLTGGSSLFGQQKPGGLFGNTGTTGTTFNSSGTFGATTGFGGTGTPGLGMGLLGGASNMGANQTQQVSGAIPVHPHILALVSSPFGDSPLLKNLSPVSGKTEELLKPTTTSQNASRGPQFKVGSGSSPKIKPKVISSAQLSKKSLFEGLEEEDPGLVEAFHPRPNAKRLVLRPKVVNQVNRSPERDQTLDNGVTDKENQATADRRSSSSWLKSSIPRKTKTLEDVDDFEGSRSPFGPEEVTEEALENTVVELRSNGSGNGVSLEKQSSPGLLQQQQQNQQQQQQQQQFQNSSVTSPGDSSGNESDEVIAQASSSSSGLILQQQDGIEESNAAKVTLRRIGYYTNPPLERLGDYVRGETCVVPNFTIGREGYGNVFFFDSFDIYGLNLDEIVHFRHKEVVIYPDDTKKPPVGQGLNRKAQVTLDRVWPQDKSLHEPITDPRRLVAMDYEGKLRRVSDKHDTRFLEYRPETGSWVFKVDHFSKYGLSDSDEEDEEVNDLEVKKKLKGGPPGQPGTTKGAKQLLKGKQLTSAAAKGAKYLLLNGNAAQADEETLDETASFNSDIFMDESIHNGRAEKHASALSPTAAFARVSGTDSHKLQLMKASFFDAGDEDDADVQRPHSREPPARSFPRNVPLQRLLEAPEPLESMDTRDSQYPHAVQHLKQTPVEPKPPLEEFLTPRGAPSVPVTSSSVVLKHQFEVVPLEKSFTRALDFRCLADAGIAMGRSFRASWGPGLTLLSLSTHNRAASCQLVNTFSELGSYLRGRDPYDNSSSNIVQRIKILGGPGAHGFRGNIEAHLRVQLDHCILGHEQDCPVVFVPVTPENTSALQAHASLAQDQATAVQELEQELERNPEDPLVTYSGDIWKLCVALWGQQGAGEPKDSHGAVMQRREALSEWLRAVVEPTVRMEEDLVENLETEVEKHERKIYALLTALNLEEATRMARESGDYSLALLMAQLTSGSAVKDLLRQQLAFWQETGVDGYVSTQRLKVFMLLAGEPLLTSQGDSTTVNVCEGLDWKRAFAVHLWYLSAPTASVTDALEDYERAFEGAEAYANAPRPEYRGQYDYEPEFEPGKKGVYDLEYHLLKLYCTGTHPMEQILNPLTHTADPLDYRLSWLLMQILTGLGYSHLSEHVAALTHVNFATQLETFGLWHWAVFVMLHLKDPNRRRIAVMDLLSRHIQIDEDSPDDPQDQDPDQDYARREEFLREELGISSIWIHQAKAIRSRACGRYNEAAYYLIQAEEWNAAHGIIIEHLAPDAVINENYAYLRSLLQPLVRLEDGGHAISGWAHQGQLLWDYMEITSQIQELLASSAADFGTIGYKLESLKPQLTSLCYKINQFPCPTSKHRLCQAEIAKKTLQLANSLLMLQNESQSSAKVLVHLVAQLPLPEDYAQQELRPITNMCFKEIIGH